MYLELAKRNLQRTKVRSILAVVGIVIGVMAIASIGIFGESLKTSVLENFKEIANEVIITPAYSNGYSKIDESDINKLEKMVYAESVIPIKSDRLIVEYKKKRSYTTIYGMDEEDVDKLFDADDGSIKLKGSCVVGYRLAEDKDLRVGYKIKIGNDKFRISGILKKEGRRFDINPDFVIFVSPKDFEKISDEGCSMVIVKVNELENVEAFKNAVEKSINGRKEKVNIFELQLITERIDEAFSQINTFLMAIAAISLLVAGVSILNIMLMSTIERTKEIGVMRAIGAYRQTILKIFLLEALILGVIGSTIGGVLSILGGYAIDMIMLHNAKYLFMPSTAFYIAEGFFVGVVTAVLSGIYPAWKASKLEPIEALRYE
ncbi:ABC transporter permease [Archaeoglobales archaeon]|nr:MAG: ABC transporter permease [Archaeoglobales archaeon]